MKLKIFLTAMAVCFMGLYGCGTASDKYISKYKGANGKYGFYNEKTGKQISLPMWDEASFFYEGLAMVMFNNKGEKKYFYVDITGTVVIGVGYDAANIFYSYGYAHVAKKNEKGELKWGCIDKYGTEVVPLVYDKVSHLGFVKDLCAVANFDKEGKLKWGFIDKKLNTVIPFIYEGGKVSYGFSDGLAEVELDGQKIYINTKGERVEKR